MSVNLYKAVPGGFDSVSGVSWDTSVEVSLGLSAWFLMGVNNLFTSANTISASNQKAQARFFDKSKHTSSFEGLVFTGELGESVRMISNRSHELASAMQKAYDYQTLRTKTQWFDPLFQFRKYGIRPKKVSLGTLISQKAGYWLENCYGWSPLINDMKAGAEALAQHVYNKGQHHSGSSQVSCGGHRSENTFSTTCWGVNLGASFTGGQAQVTRKELIEHRYGARRSMASAMNPSQFQSFANAINFRWDSVLPAAWELIPYSFVVDSFTNVGDMISAVCTDTSGLYGGWLVSVREIEVSKRFVFPFGSTGQQKYRAVSFTRGPWNVGYQPQLTFHLPSAGGAANLSALALSKVRTLSNALSVLF